MLKLIWNAQRCNECSLCVIKQIIFDQAKQKIFAWIENSSKCYTYFTTLLQKCISEINLSLHNFAVETNRFKSAPKKQRNAYTCIVILIVWKISFYITVSFV